MRKKTRALSGASQDAYFRRVLKGHAGVPADARDQIVRQLRAQVAQLRVRAEPATLEEPRPAAVHAALPETAVASARETPAPAPPPAFDPFTPNVVVLVRTAGRERALAALGAIECAEHLRQLAREQRLSIAAELASASEIRAAIVAAAERRIANRLAAAG